MTPTLIVLGFLALGVGIVAFATRRRVSPSDLVRTEQDTAWGEPSTGEPAGHDPFAHAPAPQAAADPRREEETLP